MTTPMIARTIRDEAKDIWKELAAPLPPDVIQWRQDGRPVFRDGKNIARFVGYIDAQFVQERFDAVCPGEWDSTLEPLPNIVSMDGEEGHEPYAFKCRIQVLGVIREDVGQGKDYKTAATDAFKRAAVRFGIGRELYALKPNYVHMDGDGRYAKPIEEPGIAYARRYGRVGPTGLQKTTAVLDAQQEYGAVPERETGESASGTDEISHSASPSDEPTCPKCDGRMWDNRLTKRNPKAPDFKCRDRSCDGVIWPPKTTEPHPSAKPGRESVQGPRETFGEEIPF